jgi:hypothetical protein
MSAEVIVDDCDALVRHTATLVELHKNQRISLSEFCDNALTNFVKQPQKNWEIGFRSLPDELARQCQSNWKEFLEARNFRIAVQPRLALGLTDQEEAVLQGELEPVLRTLLVALSERCNRLGR